jgi:hypothetical protein
MKKLLFFFIILLTRISSKFKDELIDLLHKIKNMLKTETRESKRMIEIYLRNASGKTVTDEDKNWANDQLKDIFRTFGVGALLILPFAPITLPFIVKLGQKLGISILPDSFKIND